MDDPLDRFVALDYFHNRLGIANIFLIEGKPRLCFKLSQARALESDRIVVVHIIDPDDGVAASKKRGGHVVTDEPRDPSDQNEHVRPWPPERQSEKCCKFRE